MIRAIIQAGFGNQLFQYATAYTLAKELNQDLELDISFYETNKNVGASNRRENNLAHLNLECNNYYSNSSRFTRNQLKAKLHIWKKERVKGKLVPVILEDLANCREDQSYLFQKIKKDGAVLYGFWQNINYFDKYLEELKKQFRPNYRYADAVSKMLNEVERTESVGVHIRRGDFVNLGWNKGQEYYTHAMEWMMDQYENVMFYVVTDDVDWAKEHYETMNNVKIIDFHTDTKDIDEFYLLSSCKHQIISESTYGWWAAYLNDNKDKKVVAPKDAKGNIFKDDWHKM